MKLKLDENGHVVLKAGFPVWVADDGTEIAYNVPDLVNKISAVNGESLETVANLDAGKLMDAGKVEELKKSIAQSFEAKISDLQKANETATAESAARLKSKDDSIRNLMVRGAFDRSSYLRDATVLPPDLAYQSFGKYCEVSEENGQLRNVWKDFNGQPIFSRANPGTPASDDEAIETLIGAYPMKDRILKTRPSTQDADGHERRVHRHRLGDNTWRIP